MIILAIIIALLISFSLHVYFLIQYIQTHKKKFLTYFLNTSASNILFAIALIFISLYKPQIIKQIDIKVFLWLVAGAIMAMALLMQGIILRKIYLRAQEPENFHLNFFGKKVLHPSVVKPLYVMAFFVSMPFLLLAGAYFVARLINLILYGHL